MIKNQKLYLTHDLIYLILAIGPVEALALDNALLAVFSASAALRNFNLTGIVQLNFAPSHPCWSLKFKDGMFN